MSQTPARHEPLLVGQRLGVGFVVADQHERHVALTRVRLQAYGMLRWAGCADAVLGLLVMLYGDRLIGEITVVGPVTVSELIAAILLIPGVLAVFFARAPHKQARFDSF